ncbi:SPOR domain-containing protein [Loktanella sp. M215]|uniref:SPOR domain-containing protein n=1 Tax=Loktanella sp. M215 TaxID=2675431 RepID=UPI001F98D4E1|nr:SPOR domain-containing protein [Loktanella sp. M215]
MADGLEQAFHQITRHGGPSVRLGWRRATCAVAVLSLAALAGCDKMPKMGGSGAADAVSADGMALAERDVEAPEVFSLTEAGLWDGRPSLGGVWVAHPTVTDPERVIIRNTANGKFVIGALFRRELDNPGPALQISSDAAEALGVLAGSPATLSVIALRREEAPASDATAITDFNAPEVIAATPLDPAPTDLAATDTTMPEVAPVATALPAAAPAAPAPAPTSGLEKPFIQIGIFSIEANANETADRLRADGLSASVLAQNSQGKSFWRVVVGPAPTAADRTAVLDKIKALGFPDAYAVTN